MISFTVLFFSPLQLLAITWNVSKNKRTVSLKHFWSKMSAFLLAPYLPRLFLLCCLESCVGRVCSVLSVSLRPCRLSPVHGILQARSLEWVATSSSRGSPGPSDQTPVSCLLHRQADFWPQGLLGSLQRVIAKAQTRSTGKPGQPAPAVRHLPPVSAPPHLCVCTFATEKDRVGLFPSFLLIV